MSAIWGQANAYARFVIILMFVVLPALAIWLTWIAEKGGTHGHEKN
ncbi:MAG: hypothetical protein ACOCG5_08865 [Candidatus Alkaliphilus sp. MAG34]